MKNKNPLYVVKGKDVEEAASLVDLVIKRFNLEPVIQIMKSIFAMLLEQVQTYAMYKAVMNYINEMMQKMQELGKKFGLLT